MTKLTRSPQATFNATSAHAHGEWNECCRAPKSEDLMSQVSPALRKIEQLDWSSVLEDLRIPPGNQLEALKGNRKGQYSIRVNDPWRVCFVWTREGPKDVGVPAQRIGDIVAGKRAITADTDLRLCRYFGLSDGWWLRGQVNYDTAIARESMGEALARISRCELLAG